MHTRAHARAHTHVWQAVGQIQTHMKYSYIYEPLSMPASLFSKKSVPLSNQKTTFIYPQSRYIHEETQNS